MSFSLDNTFQYATSKESTTIPQNFLRENMPQNEILCVIAKVWYFGPRLFRIIKNKTRQSIQWTPGS